eukprot:scpid105108/ scgid18156/ 
MAEVFVDGDRCAPTHEQAIIFVKLLWDSLMTLSAEDLEGDRPLGPAPSRSGHCADVFWGAPHFLPGFKIYFSNISQPAARIHIRTVAELKQHLAAKMEGYTRVYSETGMLSSYSLQPSLALSEIDIRSKLVFQLPGDENSPVQIGDMSAKVTSREMPDSCLHICVSELHVRWA